MISDEDKEEFRGVRFLHSPSAMVRSEDRQDWTGLEHVSPISFKALVSEET